jgi:hypothetical protein
MTTQDTPTMLGIDLRKETLLGLAEAARRLPSARQGKAVTPSCLWRWAHRGVRLDNGRTVRLEVVRLAGRWLTSMEALVRFIERQTPSFEESSEQTPQPQSQPRGRKATRQAERAAKEREQLGI